MTRIRLCWGAMVAFTVAWAIWPTAAAPVPTSKSSDPCRCPVIPPVATSDKPDPGKIQDELSYPDLEAIFSNREALYGGSWDKALTALAHDIDPSGVLRIWDTPAPTPLDRKATLEEGGVSYWLVNGRQAPLKGRPMARGNRWQYSTNAPTLVMLGTIARSNKYGEPMFGLRKALLRIFRFLAEDLDRVPLEQMRLWKPPPFSLNPVQGLRPGSKAVYVAKAARDARQTLLGALEAATPQRKDFFAKTGRGLERSFASGELQLDVFDIANAALDVIASVDEEGKRDGIRIHPDKDYVHINWWDSSAPMQGKPNFGLGHINNYVHELVWALVRLAGARAVFGGSAQANSPQDAVGCKAFTILVALSAVSTKDSESVRSELWSHLTQSVVFPDPKTLPEKRAARAAALQAGITDDEGERAAELMFETVSGENEELECAKSKRSDCVHHYADGIDLREVDVALNRYLATMRDVEGFAAGSGRGAFTQVLNDHWAGIQKRMDEAVKAGYDPYKSGSRADPLLLDKWKASSADWNPVIAQQLCAPAGTPPRVLILAKGVFNPILVDKFYINVPLMLAVVFDEPYGGDEYPVAVQIGGRKLQLIARPVDDERRMFQTESFIIGPKPWAPLGGR